MGGGKRGRGSDGGSGGNAVIWVRMYLLCLLFFFFLFKMKSHVAQAGL